METKPKSINPANVMFLVENNNTLRIFYRSEDIEEDALSIGRSLNTDPQNIRIVDWECDFFSADFGYDRCFEIHPQVFRASIILQELYFRQMLGKVRFYSIEDTHEEMTQGSSFLKDIREMREDIKSIAIKLSGDDFYHRPYAVIKFNDTKSGYKTNTVLSFSGTEDRQLQELKKFGKMLSMERRLKLQEDDLIVSGTDKSFTIY